MRFTKIINSVSYTHLDVYKRQATGQEAAAGRRKFNSTRRTRDYTTISGIDFLSYNLQSVAGSSNQYCRRSHTAREYTPITDKDISATFYEAAAGRFIQIDVYKRQLQTYSVCRPATRSI